MKRLSFRQAEELARANIQRELGGYVIPKNFREQVYVESRPDGKNYIFELCIPGKDDRSANVVAKAKVDTETGKVSVEVFGVSHR
jgi:hypothetical protein